MRILFVSSECAPFAKTGGLGDVSAALPKALAKEGHDVRVVIPCYRRVWESGFYAPTLFERLEVNIGGRKVPFEVFEAHLDAKSDGSRGGRPPGENTAESASSGKKKASAKGAKAAGKKRAKDRAKDEASAPVSSSNDEASTKVPVYLVHCPALYDRPGIYTQDSDEHVRFALLNWAALRIAQQLGFAPDIVHANDWQTGLLPLLLKRNFSWDRLFANTRTVFTIHNIGHQGTFGANVLSEIGMANERDAFHQERLAEGHLSFMLTGLQYADAITTVSPTYAHEIQTPQHGVGLDGFLRARSNVLRGILNGIDEDEWNPATDPHIEKNYSIDTLDDKEENKRALCQAMRIPYRKHAPVIGIVSRLAWQKGFDLCFESLPTLLGGRDAQLVVLGSGEAKYEEFFRALARRAPDQVAFKNGFSEPMAHAIEAGADLFLMPSRYEPCGLNQMYSCRYGTAPIVHRTGGLADTVQQFNPQTGEGNGFVFDYFDSTGLTWALFHAVDTFHHRETFAQVQRNGMGGEFGWKARVAEYEGLYRALRH